MEGGEWRGVGVALKMSILLCLSQKENLCLLSRFVLFWPYTSLKVGVWMGGERCEDEFCT